MKFHSVFVATLKGSAAIHWIISFSLSLNFQLHLQFIVLPPTIYYYVRSLSGFFLTRVTQCSVT